MLNEQVITAVFAAALLPIAQIFVQATDIINPSFFHDASITTLLGAGLIGMIKFYLSKEKEHKVEIEKLRLEIKELNEKLIEKNDSNGNRS